jgi:hypothetical protein
MKKLLILFINILALATMALGQEFAIKKVELTADQVIIHYDLKDTTRYRTYTIRVYSSVDKFLAPLKNVDGDVGLEVVSGENKKIIWNSKSEMGVSFIGNVELDIRGRVYIPFIRLVGFEDIKDVKRTKPFIVKWTGGTTQNVLNFQLYNREDKLVHTFPNAPNELQFTLNIPSSVKAGKGYYFRIADSKNADLVVKSPVFAVKPKYPLALKAIPIALVAGGAYLVLGKSASEKTSSDLEGPPDKP